MNTEETKQLRLLALFHYVAGGITALFSCMPFIHVFMGLAIISGTFFEEADGTPPPAQIGWMFVIMGSLFILTGWVISIGMIVAGRKISQQKSRIYCMVIAGIECMFMPFGTVLGVFTLIALNKESIKDAFQSATHRSNRNIT
ncbi:hypothetical protein [Pontiella agarivorans]|uniref:DUF4064 domain-containing protein n=1 Tax=Pontiella agarivorans TaxID=3038953 RepID=A0ABU5MUE6_9BACT|nr:hypothetical protein [Pontiella agarivorans]MDZ8117780.1 hypothetical protein [Pontiella agarivorans]